MNNKRKGSRPLSPIKSKTGQDPGALLLEEYARRRDSIRACYERFFKTQND